MDNLASRGVKVLIPPDAGKRKGAGPGWDGCRYAFMRRVLETDAGAGLYAKRRVMIEPVFANTKFNLRLDRFLRRGRSACRSEWRLITATHNLLKLHTHLTAATGAQRRPAAALVPPPRCVSIDAERAQLSLYATATATSERAALSGSRTGRRPTPCGSCPWSPCTCLAGPRVGCTRSSC
jgi:hypothetical protein